MNTKHYLWLWTCLWLFPAWGLGQGNYQFSVLPAVNVNKKLEKGWKANLKIESRYHFSEGIFGQDAEPRNEYGLTDVSLLFAKKVGLSSSLAGGYLIRFEEGQIVHRFIQQFALTQRLAGLRLSHRIALDQSFIPQGSSVYRFRYRIAVELPLSGQSVDPREFYVKANNEYLNQFREAEYDLEIRLVPSLGYKFRDDNKLELGHSYRLSSFLDGDARHRFWPTLTWYLVF